MIFFIIRYVVTFLILLQLICILCGCGGGQRPCATKGGGESGSDPCKEKER